MSINININSWIIEHTGTHEGYAYDKLQIKESSGHRLYLTTIKNGMRMNTMIKIMKLEEIRECTKSIETDPVYVKTITILIHIILYTLSR